MPPRRLSSGRKSIGLTSKRDASFCPGSIVCQYLPRRLIRQLILLVDSNFPRPQTPSVSPWTSACATR